MNTAYINSMLNNFEYNMTIVPNPLGNGVIFKYEPEAPILDRTGKKTGKTYSKLTTTIRFEDGTVCTCSNSPLDPVSSVLVSTLNGVKLPEPVLTASDSAKEAGFVACIFKRCCGAIGKNGVIDGTGIGSWLSKQVTKNAYDQTLMPVYEQAFKKLQAKKNAAEHAELAKKAHARKLKKMAKQLKLKSEAEALAAGKAKSLNETASAFSEKSEHHCHCHYHENKSKRSVYKRPNKKFADFTKEERRAYWRAQKASLL